MDVALTLAGSRRRRSVRRQLGLLVFGLGLISILGYLSVSFVVAERFTHAERHRIGRPPTVAAPYEDVTLRTPDGLSLRGWYFSVPTDRAAVVVHGRNGNRIGGEKLTQEHIADFLIRDGFSVLLFDLRGHGDSDGDRFSLGYRERIDVATAIDYVTGRGIPEGRIVLIGISMGAGTVLQTLKLHPSVGAIVADSGYTDARTITAEDLPSVAGVPAWFAPGVLLVAKTAFGLDGDDVRPIEVVRAHPEVAFLFIHCDIDAMVLLHHARELRAASVNPGSQLWIATGCQHAWAYNEYPTEWQTRVEGYLASQIPTAATR